MAKKNYESLAEAFKIFARYEEGEYHTVAEHDIIFAGPNPDLVSEEDKKRLKELHWYYGDEEEAAEGFYYFT